MKKLIAALVCLSIYSCSMQSIDKFAKRIKNQKKGQEAYIDDAEIPMLALKISNKSEVDQMYSYYNKNGVEVIGVLPPTNTVFIDLATVDLSKKELFGITNIAEHVAHNKKSLNVTFLGRKYAVTARMMERVEITVTLTDTGSTINLEPVLPEIASQHYR